MDASLFWLLHDSATSSWVASVATFLSSFWVPLLSSLALGPYLLAKKRYASILCIALAAGGGDALTARILKPTFDRERPCRVLEVHKVARCGAGKSFPSGHATVAFAYATSAVLLTRVAAPLIVVAFLVALSRVVLGVHYPSDVAAGAVVGAFVGLAFWTVWRRYGARRERPSPNG